MSSPAPAYRFTGREHDEPTLLYYYRARYYHTDLQRFISEDPIRLRSRDPNLYVHVRNNPLRYVDPLGLTPRQPCNGLGCDPTSFLASELFPARFSPILFAALSPVEASESSGANAGAVEAAKLGAQATHHIDEGTFLIGIGVLGVAAGIITDEPFLVLGGGIVGLYGTYEYILGRMQLRMVEKLNPPAR